MPERLGKFDIDCIAMEMVNMFHGVQYYDSVTGTPIKPPRPGYLSFTHDGDMEDTIIPARGYLYFHTDTGPYAHIQPKALARSLAAAFQAFNPHGRDENFVYLPGSGTQMTLCAKDAEEDKTSTIAIFSTERDVWKSKSVDAHMAWYMTAERALCRYQTPDPIGREPWRLAMACTTIIIDMKHEEYLPRGFFSLNHLPPPSHVKFIESPIYIDEKCGAELHLWHLLTDKKPAVFMELKLPTFEAPSLDTLTPSNGKLGWKSCHICEAPVWGMFYIFAIDEKNCQTICKFCIHYNQTLMPQNATILVAKSPLDVMNVANGIRDMTPDLRAAVKAMLIVPPKVVESSPTGVFKSDELFEYYVSGNYVGIGHWGVLTNAIINRAKNVTFFVVR